MCHLTQRDMEVGRFLAIRELEILFQTGPSLFHPHGKDLVNQPLADFLDPALAGKVQEFYRHLGDFEGFDCPKCPPRK